MIRNIKGATFTLLFPRSDEKPVMDPPPPDEFLTDKGTTHNIMQIRQYLTEG